MRGVATCTENLVIPALGVCILLNGERLEYQPKYFVQHLSNCSPPLIQQLQCKILFHNGNWQESHLYESVR